MQTPEEVASEFRIESGWLVREVNEHTCGSSGTEWPYAHEPGCGTIPELRLDALPGWPGAEVERLRAGIERLARTGYDHTPDCESERERARLAWHPDCGRCWQDVLHALLTPTEGEKNNG